MLDETSTAKDSLVKKTLKVSNQQRSEKMERFVNNARTQLWKQLQGDVTLSTHSGASTSSKAEEEKNNEPSFSVSQSSGHGGSNMGNADLGYLAKTQENIRSKLSVAFEQRMSTSLLIVGAPGSGKGMLVDNILKEYLVRYTDNNDGIDNDKNLNENHDPMMNDNDNAYPFSLARIQGAVCATDSQALISIANQLCLRKKDHSLVSAVEDMEDHLKQCHLNGQPAVIVLEDIDQFCTREKQLLIYTLLDLMHKQNLLFVVVGTTTKAHLSVLLEKRVLSRLNAQFVYMEPAGGDEICDILKRRLTLPSVTVSSASNEAHKFNIENENEHDNTLVQSNTKEIDEEENRYRSIFNEVITDLFGETRQGFDKDTDTADPDNNKDAAATKKRGKLFSFISGYCAWGKGVRHFLLLSTLMVASLTSDMPYFTEQQFTSLSNNQAPFSLLERLAQLSLLELHLFAMASRLYAKKNAHILGMAGAQFSNNNSKSMLANGDGTGMHMNANTHGSFLSTTTTTSSSFKTKDKNKENFVTLREIFAEMDKFTGTNLSQSSLYVIHSSNLSKQMFTRSHATQAILNLQTNQLIACSNNISNTSNTHTVQAESSLTNQTIVLLIPMYHEIRHAFAYTGESTDTNNVTGSSNTNITGKKSTITSIGRHQPRLVLSDRIRRAVIEPLETGQNSESLL